MEFKSIEEQIIQKYKDDENLMIRLFVQWCVNHQLNPQALYQQAYPEQQPNPALKEIMENDDGFEELHIDNETMLDVLQLFGNDDLAFVVADEIAKFTS
ncbi:hypothetical protein CSV80_10195 [Sporosarcina sp. P12(2017)]|uniref:hypothetical protein n=1 Tax=unclassified Sporosarcina TaxID=2647733 RepID=UPI000C17348C|nr:MULTISPECIES: hypothetical protein [unclassified Sporosarcina]PIC57075.1 hypothetical protein CSV81_10525 [Sporosarcina sp. P10]PIC60457.1 hypothetical protein CSV80_10195 [Sporosarcina sp. P12(2017)]